LVCDPQNREFRNANDAWQAKTDLPVDLPPGLLHFSSMVGLIHRLEQRTDTNTAASCELFWEGLLTTLSMLNFHLNISKQRYELATRLLKLNKAAAFLHEDSTDEPNLVQLQ
jgi:hypothetical protein